MSWALGFLDPISPPDPTKQKELLFFPFHRGGKQRLREVRQQKVAEPGHKPVSGSQVRAASHYAGLAGPFA